MSRKLNRAAVAAVAAMLTTTMVFAADAGALAQESEASTIDASTQGQNSQDAANDPVFVSQPVVQFVPEQHEPQVEASVPEADDASSLRELVSYLPTDVELSKDLHCLAGAIYFESRGEPLDGQLAVGRVIVNRADSGRFPESYCGVVYQRSQFSFVKGGRMPAINTASKAWKQAKAVAQVAHEGLWDSPAQGALFFHATHVNPGWRLKRVGQVSRHIFYR